MLSVLSMILAGLALYFYRRRFRLSRSSGEKRLDLFSVCLLSAVAGWLCAVLFTPFAPTKVVSEVSALHVRMQMRGEQPCGVGGIDQQLGISAEE